MIFRVSLFLKIGLFKLERTKFANPHKAENGGEISDTTLKLRRLLSTSHERSFFFLMPLSSLRLHKFKQKMSLFTKTDTYTSRVSWLRYNFVLSWWYCFLFLGPPHSIVLATCYGGWNCDDEGNIAKPTPLPLPRFSHHLFSVTRRTDWAVFTVSGVGCFLSFSLRESTDWSVLK